MTEPIDLDDAATRRIESERIYHEQYYRRHAAALEVDFALSTSVVRKPHNLTWAYYDAILGHFGGDVRGKKLLVVGCGAGLVALNLARSGALVDGFDVSKEAIALCKRRAEFNNIAGVNFFVSSCENVQLPEEHYDAIVGEMILHHVDIPAAVRQFQRLLKEGGLGVFMEWKQYCIIDRMRALPLLRRLFPPGGVQGYATEYERKLTAADFTVIRSRFPDLRLDYRHCLRGKIDYFAPSLGDRIERLDYLLLRLMPFLKPFTDGVIIRFTKRSESK